MKGYEVFVIILKLFYLLINNTEIYGGSVS